jgi:hypothetical protein
MSRIEPDFRVRYRFLTVEEGGRSVQPAQGRYRPDWIYVDDPPKQCWVIWPTFEDEGGTPLEHGARIPKQGLASMTIVDPKMRGEVHRNRIAVGIRGFMVEGSRRVVEAEVTEVLGLMRNPI